MNIPVGNFVEKGIDARKISLEKKLSELSGKLFSGYVALTAEGYTGIEEGVIIMRRGELTGAVFEFVKFGDTVFSDDALKLTANAARAQFAVADIIELSKQQAELVIAFNDKMAFSSPKQPKDLSRVIPQNYDAELVKKFVGDRLRKEGSRSDIMKKLGLKEL